LAKLAGMTKVKIYFTSILSLYQALLAAAFYQNSTKQKIAP
jgi:hypothetical protein